MVAASNSVASYPTSIGYVLVFNLIVGTGALALPKAFQSAGYILGAVLLLISAFMSYVCATFVVEGMAVANAALQRKKLRSNKERTEEQINNAFRIRKQVEVSTMAKLFMGRYGILCLNSIVTVYLFGDLAVYTTAVPKSIMNIVCQPVNASTEHGHNACHDGWPDWLERMTVYRMSICVFVCFVTPMVLIGVHRTKYLQISTSISRWTAFSLMIVLACMQLWRDGSPQIPQMVNIHGFGSLFGTTVYAFMCHHSLPSLITPMKSKRHVFLYMALVYALVLAFYLSLAVSGAFSFDHIFDVYSLNFLHNETYSIHELLINYFLAFFPVFTLTSNYPIVACTLINNLTVLVDLIGELLVPVDDLKKSCPPLAFDHNSNAIIKRYSKTLREHRLDCVNKDSDEIPSEKKKPAAEKSLEIIEEGSKPPNSKDAELARLRHYAIAFIVISSATLVALFTDDVLALTTVTGSYPGVGVQYIIPSLIVIFGRRFSRCVMGAEVPSSARSPFSSSVWPIMMLLWSALTVIMVTLNFCSAFDYIPS